MNVRIKDKKWVVYIVECTNRSLYTGITNDLERRLKEHNSKKGGHYTSSFGPVKLLRKEPQPDRSSALKREARIKRLSRREKLALIKGKTDRGQGTAVSK